MAKAELLELAQTRYYGFNAIEYVGEWKGYQVYELYIDDDSTEILAIGLPTYVLTKDEKARLNESEEALEILGHIYRD